MAEVREVRDWTDAPRAAVLDAYWRVRAETETLCAPLETDDYGLQTMPDVSPAKWHIAHTSWFFETFILARFATGYRPHHPAYDHLFNSYYVTHGEPFLRPRRAFLSRPTVDAVYAYRHAVDAAVARLAETADAATWRRVEPLLVLGLNHEQQHQELLLTDIKHAFSYNPLYPAYRPDLATPPTGTPGTTQWLSYPGGLYEIGAAGEAFAYDNESPRHRVWLEDFVLADRPVTNADFIAFIDDGGYREPRWWLSEGWATVRAEGWQAPLYWARRDGEWWHFTLGGMRRVDLAAPVCHVSYYEADAYASWAGRRLPTEAEWEVVATHAGGDTRTGNLRESGWLQPAAAAGPAEGPRQLFGDVWEWTGSAYSAYPGFRIPDGPVGEYNGKFMSGQMVLRGGSCVTPGDHVRASYRNFFYPKDRWQFSGIRLAADA